MHAMCDNKQKLIETHNYLVIMHDKKKKKENNEKPQCNTTTKLSEEVKISRGSRGLCQLLDLSGPKILVDLLCAKIVISRHLLHDNCCRLFTKEG